MTSKISLPKLIKEDLKKRMWLTALSAVIFIIIIPLSTLLQIESKLAYMGIPATAQEWKEICIWFSNWMGLENLPMISAIMMGALFSGITSFSYLHSKSQMDFYHSLPVRRETWFAATYIGSFIQVVVPYLIGYGVMVLFGVMKKVSSPEIFNQWLLSNGIMILFFLLVYSITIFAMILTGKFVVAMFGVVALTFGGTLISALKIYIMVQNFETFLGEEYYHGIMGNILFGKAGWFSPVIAYGKIMELYLDKESITKPIMIIAACTILISVFALMLYRKRASEGAGNAIAFPRLKPVLKVVVAVMAGLFFGVIMGSQNRSQGMNAGWLFGVGILATVLACAVMEFIYHGDIRLIFKKKISLVISVISVVAILAATKYDVFGYDTYLPDKDKIEAMAVDSYRVRDRWLRTDRTKEKTYIEYLESLRTEEFDVIYELAGNGVEQLGVEHQQLETINIAYYLKSGKKVYRTYQVEPDKFMECMGEIMEDEEYRGKLFGFDELQSEKMKKIEFYNFKHEPTICDLSPEKKDKLIEAYKHDALKQPISTFENGNAIGDLIFEYDTENSEFYSGYLYDSFTETIALLKEYGYEVPTQINVDEVKSIQIYKYGPIDFEEEAVDYKVEKGRNGEPITDPVEMQKILERICYKENANTERNIDVEVMFKSGHREISVIYFLRKE